MANSLLEISASIREAVGKAAAYTVGLERDPYAVSGVLIGGKRILTASHLVHGDGADLLMPDGNRARAKVLARDPVHDLALLVLESKTEFPVPAAGRVGVGDIVISLKRDPFDGINAALSIVSAEGSGLKLGRFGAVEKYLQISAERMPGSTGGPLADGGGILAGVQVFNKRMGHEIAIPAGLALQRAALLEERGSVKRPYLGIRSQRVPLSKAARAALAERQETGLLVVQVEEDSAAAHGGLEVGDILVGFAGASVTDHEGLLDGLSESGAGAKVEVEVARGGERRTLAISIGSA